MILQALNCYYQRLEEDPNIDIAPFGFSRQKIAFCITLNRDGSLHSIDDIRDSKGAKCVPKPMIVCGNAKPSGSGINPGFLWDNPAYSLGYKADDPKPERTRESFEAFRQRHLDAEKGVDDPEFSAVCRFLESWNPAVAKKHGSLIKIGTGFGVFRIRAADHFVHERPAVKRSWKKQLASTTNDEDSTVGHCLVTGEVGRLARLHEPKIQGVWGAQSAGAAIVSFNLDAFDSYGKKQSVNSPVSEPAAFQYCTALNHLLRTGSKQRIQIGDTTTVFWTERSTETESLLPWIFGRSTASEDDALKLRIHSLLRQIASGNYPSELGKPDTQFYVLGLSPNAARLSVRFWHISTLGELVRNLTQHFADLEICDIKSTTTESYHFDFAIPRPSPHRILGETVPTKQGKPDHQKVSPQLAGALTNSIIANQRYPAALLDKVLYRIWADGFIDPDKRIDWRQARQRRASIVKACLNRRFRQHGSQMENLIVDAYLNKIHPDAAYHCGRLMGVVAFIQEVALKKVNSSVVRRLLSAASSAPALHLGRLQVQAEIAHLPKLKGKLPKYLRDEMKAINGQIRDEIPRRINQLRQGLFVLGFYHELAHLEHQRLSVRRLHRTRLGEWVYSKGELMVADSLAAQGIEYVYEPKALLSGEDRIPDFIILGTEKNEDRYIEYLGMDTEEYNEDWTKKHRSYIKAGITDDGGPNGWLYVIDGRKDAWDEVRIHRQLKNWFSS